MRSLLSNEEAQEALEAYAKEMEELKEKDPIVHDFRVLYAKMAKGLEIQQQAMGEMMEVIAYYLKKKEEK